MEVVKIQRKNGKVVCDCDVYIGRACFQGGWELKQSIWHNPYSVKQYGKEECLILYEKYLRDKLEREPIMKIELLKLKDKKLGCWCKPEKCHGDIILKLFNEFHR